MIELNQEERASLSRLLMSILDEWKLTAEQQVQLLGLPAETRARALARFRAGEVMPDDGDLVVRAQDLLAIHDALRVAFPMNEALAPMWVSTPSPHFGERTPLELMLEQGMSGIASVKNHLLQSGDEWGQQ